ncbi:protein PAL OF QUIRKY [Rosa rugosa]|uniref:protein PAL OF QUIRKY n=1 Tax=Rosa rugosa TaxID=74645 RepID=UPI002B407864|nr:protein PAL OF QUIRKY [Rosa rugosa]
MVGPSADPTNTLKFLCSYSGKILPRYPDGKLRYLGGETRVLAVHRSISFSELLLKLGELCGTTVGLRCQLPTEDLDALISVKCDEDLANLIEEYDTAAAAATPLKIRAFLSLPANKIPTSPPSSSASSSKSSSSNHSTTCASGSTPRFSMPLPAERCLRQVSHTAPFQRAPAAAGKDPHCANYQAHGNPSRLYLVHNGNHWQ